MKANCYPAVYKSDKGMMQRVWVTIPHEGKPLSVTLGLGEQTQRVKLNEGTNKFYFEIPETTVKDMGELLKEKMRLNGLRYIGDPDGVIRKIALVGHLCVNAFGTDHEDENGYLHEYATEVIRLMENGVDAIIPGEVIDWTAVSYIRDAHMLGKNKTIYNVGHYNWEEPGMWYAQQWIQELVGNEVPVIFVPAGDIYQFM